MSDQDTPRLRNGKMDPMSNKRQLLIEALRQTLDSCLNDSTILYSAIPDHLVDQIIAQGWAPKEEPFVEQWRKIPGYDYWEMSNGNMVRHVMTKECVPITYTTDDPVTITIHDNFGKDQTVFLMELAERTWPRGLIGLSLDEAAQLFNEPGELTGKSTPVEIVEEWRDIDCIIGLNNFEIERGGVIRNKNTGHIPHSEYDAERDVYAVNLILNGKPIKIIGEELAKVVWNTNN